MGEHEGGERDAGTRDVGAELEPGPIGEEELAQRLVYATLLPAVRLALASGMGSKDFARWAELAAFHEARRRGLKSREIADRLGMSMRKVAELSRRLKDNFLAPDTGHGLPRRIEFMLWAGPASASRVKQTFSEEDGDAIDAALDALEEAGRVRRIAAGRTERYERVRAESRLVADQLLARIDGLNNLLGNVADAVDARFRDEGVEAFARTVDFRVREADLPRLRALYEGVVWETLRELDQAAHDADGDDPSATMSLSILWAPHARLTRALDAGRAIDGDDDDDTD